jgi:hypothetical protein
MLANIIIGAKNLSKIPATLLDQYGNTFWVIE